jgi:cytochrome c-type biogenesis protein CcmF
VRSPWTLLTLAFGGYAAQVTLQQMWLPVMQRMRGGHSIGNAVIESQFRRGRRRFASYVVHAGAVITIIAIAVSSTMRSTSEVQLKKGESASLAGYTVTFLGVEDRAEPHRQSTIATFAVLKGGTQRTTLQPRMNQYEMMREPIGTPDVYTTAAGDLYLSILNIDQASQTVGVNIVQTPMVVWIWIAVMLMGLGGLVGVIPSRRRAAVARETTEPVIAQPASEGA